MPFRRPIRPARAAAPHHPPQAAVAAVPRRPDARTPAVDRSAAKGSAARGSPDRWLYGRHPVAAALANPERRWRRLVVAAEHQDAAAALAAAARASRRGDVVPVAAVAREALTGLLPDGAVHQGWALEVEPLPELDLDDIIRRAALNPGRCTLVLLDQVTDPHNVGAVLRSAAAFGAQAVVVTARHAPAASGVLAKAASGGLDLVPLVRVVNLAAALDRLKQAGFWSCGLDADAGQDLAALDLGPRAALVFGAEGGGLRRLVRERCDHLARLPTGAALANLNVSNAAAIALYERVRGGGQSG
jgi:23S rRNA (guanosine2251-2'-O)-methyltransferase